LSPMLKLEDFAHLPQAKTLINQLLADRRGMTIVAGLDPRPLARPASDDTFLPSGRSAFFRLLLREMLASYPAAQAILVTSSHDAFPVPPSLRRRIHFLPAEPASYAGIIGRAANQRPDLLAVDCLTADSACAAFEAAHNGLHVLSQMDTVLRGAEAARQLLELGVPRGLLDSLTWIVALQRLVTLCSRCKEPASPDPGHLADLHHRFPDLHSTIEGATFFRAPGCSQCHMKGREGENTAFDIYRTDTDTLDPLEQPSLLPLESYMLEMVTSGLLPLDDLVHFESNRLRRTYGLLTTSERALTETKTELERSVTELKAANRVLQQRTEALVSLESIGHALITSAGLDELAAQLCRNARDLCGADRSILYYVGREAGIAEVLAESGWEPSLIHQPLPADLLLDDKESTEPAAFNRWPPGVPRRPTDVTARALRAGLRVPLVVQDTLVGLMIVHTSQKPSFAPGEVALLQTFANQAAVAIQRAGLVDALQEKITQLEAAQAELVQKERMERELELARQVQQSVLPRIFPLVPGYTFAARSEPARWVGGDFYDVIHLDADRFAIVVGDVSGKGMPAALYMAQTHSLLRAEARREDSPRAVLYSVHRLLQALGRSSMFVTVFYGIVDGAARRLTYTRAGHDRPLLLRGGEIQPLGGEGTILGFPDLEDLYLSEEVLDLYPGDRLVLYTDGLIDIVSADGKPFGLERLLTLLQSHTALPPGDLLAATFTDLAAYQQTAEQFDDMTMLITSMQPKKKKE
jgi:serine phosphatase RsbU (regulator of sigma subunit)